MELAEAESFALKNNVTTGGNDRLLLLRSGGLLEHPLHSTIRLVRGQSSRCEDSGNGVGCQSLSFVM